MSGVAALSAWQVSVHSMQKGRVPQSVQSVPSSHKIGLRFKLPSASGPPSSHVPVRPEPPVPTALGLHESMHIPGGEGGGLGGGEGGGEGGGNEGGGAGGGGDGGGSVGGRIMLRSNV